MFSAADLIRDGVDSLLAESRGEISKPGHRTGVDALDKWIRITEGSYTLLGGRPSDGKSQVLLSLAYSMAALGPRIGVLSLEMNRPQITERLAKSALKVGRDVPDDLSETYRRAASEIDALLALPVFVDCPDNPLEDNVRRRLDDMAEAGAEVIMLDYVQQIRCKGNGIEERTAKASSLIKTWAQRTGIPVIAAAALRRPENDREGAKRPRVEGLRGSGMLEFDADVVLLMHNGHKYDPERGCAAVRDLYLEKNRLGMVSPFAIQIEHPEPFGFFGELTYITQMRMHRDNQ
jgi:replicative DNA helicase